MLKPNALMLLTALALAGCTAPPPTKSVESAPVIMSAPVIAAGGGKTTAAQPVESAPTDVQRRAYSADASPHNESAPAAPVNTPVVSAPKSVSKETYKAMPAPAPMASYHAMIAAPIIPARAFCMRDANCGSEYAAYGYIIFTKRPTSDAALKRYLSVCRAYIGNLETVSSYTDTPKSQIATTFWLLTSQPKDEHSCKELVALYDYARAAKIATSLQKLKAAGPLLVAWGNPYAEQSQKEQRLLIDLTRLSNTELDNAFGIWRDNISQNKSFWGKKFNVALVIEEFKSFIGKYGKLIIEVINAS